MMILVFIWFATGVLALLFAATLSDWDSSAPYGAEGYQVKVWSLLSNKSVVQIVWTGRCCLNRIGPHLTVRSDLAVRRAVRRMVKRAEHMLARRQHLDESRRDATR